MARGERLLTPEDKREYQRRWRKAHPEKTREYERRKKRDPKKRLALVKRWRIANREKYRAQLSRRAKKRKERYPEKVAAKKRRYADRVLADPVRHEESKRKQRDKNAKWQAANRERVRESSRRRYREKIHEYRPKNAVRQRKRRNLTGSHSVTQWLSRVEYYGWRCRWRHCELTIQTVTKDHVIAVAVGGTDWASNLVPACKSCNPGKGTGRAYAPPQSKLRADASIVKSKSPVSAAS